MSKNRLHNEKGFIMATVIMIIMVAMVITVSIISINTTQTMTTEREVKRLQAQEFAEGLLAYTFIDQISSTPSASITITEELDGITFTGTSAIAGGVIDITAGP